MQKKSKLTAISGMNAVGLVAETAELGVIGVIRDEAGEEGASESELVVEAGVLGALKASC